MDALSLRYIIEFLAPRDTLPPTADILFVLGSADLAVPREAARLWREGLAQRIAVCGGIGRLTGELGRAEADAYAELLRLSGVPEDSLIVENRSTNTGENISFGMELVRQRSWAHSSIILLQTPILQRRAELTFRRQFPELQVYSWAPYIPAPIPELLPLACGELERLENYGPEGKDYIAAVDIPDAVKEAWAKTLRTIPEK